MVRKVDTTSNIKKAIELGRDGGKSRGIDAGLEVKTVRLAAQKDFAAVVGVGEISQAFAAKLDNQTQVAFVSGRLSAAIGALSDVKKLAALNLLVRQAQTSYASGDSQDFDNIQALLTVIKEKSAERIVALATAAKRKNDVIGQLPDHDGLKAQLRFLALAQHSDVFGVRDPLERLVNELEPTDTPNAPAAALRPPSKKPRNQNRGMIEEVLQLTYTGGPTRAIDPGLETKAYRLAVRKDIEALVGDGRITEAFAGELTLERMPEAGQLVKEGLAEISDVWALDDLRQLSKPDEWGLDRGRDREVQRTTELFAAVCAGAERRIEDLIFGMSNVKKLMKLHREAQRRQPGDRESQFITTSVTRRLFHLATSAAPPKNILTEIGKDPTLWKDLNHFDERTGTGLFNESPELKRLAKELSK